MSSIAELVELLKEGSISKEQMLEKIYSSSFPSKSENQLVSYEKKALAPKKQNFDYDTDIDFNTLEFDDFHPRPPPSFEPSFSTYSPNEFIERQSQ